MRSIRAVSMLVVVAGLVSPARAQTAIPPYDLWTPAVLERIRDRSTLEVEVTPRLGYSDVFYTSDPSASWFEAGGSYAEHQNEKIRIHGFLAAPLTGGPYPALLFGHGHGGRADSQLATFVAALGYVVLAIDGPEAGESTGGPEDENQAWISVDKGPQYGYLYHYAYAGMRGLTLLEELASRDGNPFRIDPTRLGVLGASMGGILATYMNGVDDRLDAAVIIASAGNWHHTLRYPNSWLYHNIYASTRDRPYNGSDPLNSIEDIDRDPTAITFLNYFDPIRYAPRQHAPVLTVIGTHDQYFPFPSANLMQLAITSAGTQQDFEKRLWLLPNEPHRINTSALQLLSLASGLSEWLDYAFGKRDKPLATPQVTRSGLRFEASFAEPASRLNNGLVDLFVATKVDATAANIQDFRKYPMARSGDRFVVDVAAADLPSPDEAIFFVTAIDSGGLPVSSLVYKGSQILDLSSNFTPVLNPFSNDNIVAPVPAAPSYALESITSSLPESSGTSYQGMALTNPTGREMALKVEARTPQGRIAAAEGLINPAFMILPPNSEKIFVAEQWLGPGARHFDGSIRVSSTDAQATSLSFRGDVAPSALDAIGPMMASAASQWLPLALEQDPAAVRRLRIFASAQSTNVEVTFRNRFGELPRTQQLQVPAYGAADVELPPVTGTDGLDPGSAEIRSSAPFSARLEVTGAKDPWSVDAASSPGSPRTFVQPHVEWNGEFTTHLLIVNTTSTGQDVRFRLHNTDGSAAAPNTVLIVNPNASAFHALPITPGGPRGAGWLEAENPGGGLLLFALAVDPVTGAAATSPLQVASGETASMPFYVENAGYYTGLALANPGNVAATVTLTAIDPAGAVLGTREVTLQPGHSLTQIVAQWIPELPAESTGQIRITTSAPIALLAYFGTDDGASLAAIPFTRISP